MWCFVINVLRVTPSQEEKREVQLGGRASLQPLVWSLGHSSPRRGAGDAHLGDQRHLPGGNQGLPSPGPASQNVTMSPSVFHGRRGCAGERACKVSARAFFGFSLVGSRAGFGPQQQLALCGGTLACPWKRGGHIAPHHAPPFTGALRPSRSPPSLQKG